MAPRRSSDQNRGEGIPPPGNGPGEMAPAGGSAGGAASDQERAKQPISIARNGRSGCAETGDQLRAKWVISLERNPQRGCRTELR